jgi:WD40 repeat protein
MREAETTMFTHRIRSAVLLVLVLMCGGRAVGADDAPSEPKHKLELPFADRGPFVHDGWVGFDPKGNYLAAYYTIKGQAYVAIWDTAGNKLLDKIEAGKGWINTEYGPPAVFTANGKHLAYLVPGKVQFHPLTVDQKAQTTPVPKRDELRRDGFSGLDTSLLLPDGKEVQQLMYSSAKLTLWRDRCEVGDALKLIKTDEFTLQIALRLVVSPDRTQLAWVRGADLTKPAPWLDSVRLLALDTGKNTNLPRKNETVRCTALGFAPDGKHLAGGGADGSLTVWDLTKGKEAFGVAAPQPGGIVTVVAFSPDGTWLAYGSTDRKGKPNVRIVSLKTEKVRWAWSDNQTGVLHLCWNSKGTQLAVLGEKKVTVYHYSVRRVPSGLDSSLRLELQEPIRPRFSVFGSPQFDF